MSDDGEYLVVTTYKVINEYYVFYTRITEDRETGFKKQLKLTQLVTKPALYSVCCMLNFCISIVDAS